MTCENVQGGLPFTEGGTATLRPAISLPLKWHCSGGKGYLASRIVAMMPPHLHYVEPFAGGLAVMLAKDPEGVSEVANDLNATLTNFWSVLRHPDDFEDFRRRAEATPFSKIEWDRAAGMLDAPGNVTRAWAFFVHCRQSMAGRMESFAPLSRSRTRRGMNEQASAWIGAVDGLAAVHARLRRVAILNAPAAEVIRQQDGADTLFYLDPPYYHDTRTAPDVYAHEMTHKQHVELLETVRACKGKVMLSGYRCPTYDDRLVGWARHEWELPNNSASGASKRRMVECLWKNW
jgi:DNA adenine methylase